MPVTLPSITPISVGFWTNSTLIDRFLGQVLGDQLSNMDNITTSADPNGYNDAIGHAETNVNYQLALFGYPTGASNPTFPTTSFAYSSLSDAATVLASYWLYVKRGVFDEKDAIGGKFQKLKTEADALIKKIIRDKIPDVARGYTSQPAVILNGYGIGRPNVPSAQIQQVP